MPLYFSNSFSLIIQEENNLLILSLSFLYFNFTYPLILDNIKTNGLINLSKYPTKYLELFFVATNFEILNILPALTSQIFVVFFAQ